MNIKQKLKNMPFFSNVNAIIKARLQELKAVNELAYYRRKAFRIAMKLLEGDALVQALKKRLSKRGIYPMSKRKSELHIFLAYSLNNWEFVLPITLEAFGRVTTFQWESGGFYNCHNDWAKWRDDLNAKMLKAFNTAHSKQPIDIMVGYISDFNTTKETLIEIGKRGVAIFNMNWDDKLYFNGSVNGQCRSLSGIVSAMDINLTNAPDSIIKYLFHGGLAMFWPQAAHPDIHKPYDVPFEFDVSFVGKKYGWRAEFVQRLKRDGINIVSFGSGWDNGVLSDIDMIRLYSRSRINLGFSGVGYSRKLLCLKGRDFEVPMSGGLYLTQDNPELKLVYNVGEEILTYRNYSNCLEQIRWLLDNPDKAQKIRQAGRRRALCEHTWDNRFSQIFCMAGILKDE
jgi:hypothetical protein